MSAKGDLMTELTRLNPSIFTVHNFLTREQCGEYIRLTEARGYTSAPITTAHGPVHRPDIRNNTRVMYDDATATDDLWKLAAPCLEEWDASRQPLGLNERLRFYRYDVNQQFDWHYDGYYERPTGERSLLTFMVYLNDDFSGGETLFRETQVQPETGMALFFVHQIRHKGATVTKGRKYVLRSDVMYAYGERRFR